MTKLFSNKLALIFMGLLIVFCHLGAARAQTAGEPIRQRQPVVKPSAEPSNIVARAGDYVITKQELEKRLMMELYPRGYDSYNEQAEPVDAETVLMKMIAEKAMVRDARKLGFLKDETFGASITRFKERRLSNLLLQKQLQPKLTVTESEIKQKMKADPKLDRARAEAMLKNTKGRRLYDQYYKQIYQKFHVKKLSNNFPKAVQIHQRLLTKPKKPRKAPFIRIYQIKEELTPEEKNIVLATFSASPQDDNGKITKITLKDWFDTLCESSPPSRPRNLNTPKGVEQLLERALRMPLLVSEAKSLGFDKDKNLLKKVREYEDRGLLSKVKSEKDKEIKEPTIDEIMIYFGKNMEAFRTGRTLKIDLIWCQDLKTARQAKAELDGGKDFESVRQKYSLEKKGKPFNTSPSGEGLFWKDLWKGDPNDIVGPVKGFYRRDIKWRIVKILEKNPGKVKGYSSDIERRVKERLVNEQRDAILAKYGDELLKKYPYKIYTEKIKDIDPLDIP
ncbi:MAG: peptidyl-prolyl cis-trans isomerase [Planctomycetes bacterium]|nr:peptidyl-prolyl cis-trans isomerase [Planctomycetota bacterium]